MRFHCIQCRGALWDILIIDGMQVCSKSQA